MKHILLILKPSKPPVRKIVPMDRFFTSCMFLLMFLMIFLLTPTPSFAEFEVNSFGSARAIGEGGAYTAVTDNINSIFYNPAAVEFGSDQNYLAGYKQDNSGSTGYALGFTKKLSESDLIGFGIDNIGSSPASLGLMALSYWCF